MYQYLVFSITNDQYNNTNALMSILDKAGLDDWEHYHIDYVGDGVRLYFKRLTKSL